MRILRLVAFAAVLWSAPARADKGGFGLGLIVGQPTGITGAYELSDRVAIDAALGLGWVDNRHFYLHVEADFFLPLASGSSVALSGYIGVGGFFFDVGNDPGLGVRVPFGLSLDFAQAPVQIFLELPILLFLTPDNDVDVRGALGFRYYF